MTLEVKPFETLPKLLADLEGLALNSDDYVFRGHGKESYRIGTTYSRYTTVPFRGWDPHVDDMLSTYIANSLTHGPVPFVHNDRRSRLEYGRHHGVPTPVIDFTHSPYVAMYFALSGHQHRHGEPDTNAAIYALNTKNLGTCFAKLVRRKDEHYDDYDAFMNEKAKYFDAGYPENDLKFILFCASWNRRMRSQHGCFIYDTLNYAQIDDGITDFESFVAAQKEPPLDGVSEPILTKFILPKSQAGAVFSRLDLMNISGSSLLDREGLANDVVHGYNYTRKSGYCWDLTMPAAG